MIPKSFYILLAVFIIPNFATGANSQDILINEISWMGTIRSASDEWIELFNATDMPINLSGWTLKSSDGKLLINLKNQLSSGSFYILERTDDNTIPAISADVIYSGSLNNSGLDIALYDSTQNVIDRANFSSQWPAGDNATKQTMERAKNLTWQTSKDPSGTPRAQNSPGAEENVQLPKEPAAKSNQALAPDTELPKTYPGNIFINEILPAPEGPDEMNEWIELYNQNDFSVDLHNWKMMDTKGSATSYIFLKGTDITGQGYMVLKRPQTKITLNNDEDALKLKLPNGEIADSVSYVGAMKNQSYGKTATGWQWSKHQTPGSKNTTNTYSGNQTSLLKQKKPDNSNISSVGMAALGDATIFKENLPANNNPWFLFFIALALAIISGTTILILKFTLFKKSKK